jgi:regulator of sirC expression with transglutaminase-like and TPR domain
MRDRARITLFSHLASRPDPEVDLAEAALLVAEGEYPGLDIRRYLRALDALGQGAQAAISRAQAMGRFTEGREDEGRLQETVVWLYGEAGFQGNEEDYYDPRNSYLNEVIDRRTGIPITLAIVLVEVCRRAGIEAAGVSFPGHFLVRTETRRGTVIIDPFSGRMLGQPEVKALYSRATGGAERDPPARALEPATKSQILYRLLNNLRGIYASRDDRERLVGVLEHMLVLSPSEELRAEIAALGGGGLPWRVPGGTGLN